MIKEDVFCNKCGKSCRKYFDGDFSDIYGLDKCTVFGGYLSSNDDKGLSDMTCYTFSMCEECLRELFNTFKIPVQEDDLMP